MKNNILMEIRSLICAESPQIKHCLSIKNINFSKHLFLYTLHRMSVSLQNFEYKFPQKSIAVALKQIISRREKNYSSKLMTFYYISLRLNFKKFFGKVCHFHEDNFVYRFSNMK